MDLHWTRAKARAQTLGGCKVSPGLGGQESISSSQPGDISHVRDHM